MTERTGSSQDPTHLKRRCPRLGHDIFFGYCLECGEDHSACWKVFDCWWEIFDVAHYLKDRLPEAEYRSLAQKKPKQKVTSILEIVEAAKKRTIKGSG